MKRSEPWKLPPYQEQRNSYGEQLLTWQVRLGQPDRFEIICMHVCSLEATDEYGIGPMYMYSDFE